MSVAFISLFPMVLPLILKPITVVLLLCSLDLSPSHPCDYYHYNCGITAVAVTVSSTNTHTHKHWLMATIDMNHG